MAVGTKLLKSMLKLGRPVDAWAETTVATVAKAAMSELGMCILAALFTGSFGKGVERLKAGRRVVSVC